MTKDISIQQIRWLAKKVANSTLANDGEAIIRQLKPVLDTKCPFPKFDLLGREIGQAGRSQPQKFFKAFDEIYE